mmetsp:Transcript_15268/g.44966  ORF Transcript_15268/g.44966 Transcript_15268/m.44966 type:complete len:226 (-) Transcript_15268:267-944(-)
MLGGTSNGPNRRPCSILVAALGGACCSACRSRSAVECSCVTASSRRCVIAWCAASAASCCCSSTTLGCMSDALCGAAGACMPCCEACVAPPAPPPQPRRCAYRFGAMDSSSRSSVRASSLLSCCSTWSSSAVESRCWLPTPRQADGVAPGVAAVMGMALSPRCTVKGCNCMTGWGCWPAACASSNSVLGRPSSEAGRSITRPDATGCAAAVAAAVAACTLLALLL